MSKPDADSQLAMRVLEATASTYDVTAQAALACQRGRPGLSEAKHAAVLVLWRRHGWTLERIGTALGRHRSTIGDSIARAQDLLQAADDWFAEAVRRGERLLGSPASSQVIGWSLPRPLARGAA